MLFPLLVGLAILVVGAVIFWLVMWIGSRKLD